MGRPACSLFLGSLLACAQTAAQNPTLVQPIAGRVVDAQGQPAAGAEIVVTWRSHPELPGLVGYAIGNNGLEESRHDVDSDGRFRFDPPHRGPFQLMAMRGRYSSEQIFPVMAGDYLSLGLEASHYVGGTVLGIDGEPVQGAEVRLLPDPTIWSRLGLYRIPERRGASRSDAEGRFEMHFAHGYLRGPRLAPLVGVWVESDGLSNLPHQLVRPNGSSRVLQLTLQPHVPARGRVLDAGTGEPIVNAMVFDPIRRDRRVQTDADGEYELRNPVSPTVWIQAPAYQPALVATPRQGRRFVSSVVTTEVSGGLGLRARLLDTTGQPLEGAAVLFVIPRGRELPFEQLGRVGHDGVVSIDWAPREEVLLGFVEVAGQFVQFYGGPVHESADLGDLRVSPHRSVRGQLVDAERTPVPHARVVLQDAELMDVMPRVTYTDRGGRFRFDAVTDAEQILIAGTGAHGSVDHRLAVADLERPVQLALQKGGEIRGTVVDPRGQPVSGAWVMISRGGGLRALELPAPSLGSTALCVLTDASGKFHFRGLPEGGGWTVMGQYLRDDTVSAGSTTALNGETGLVIHMTTHVR